MPLQLDLVFKQLLYPVTTRDDAHAVCQLLTATRRYNTTDNRYDSNRDTREIDTDTPLCLRKI